jgi:type I restriction enzyme, S subunit
MSFPRYPQYKASGVEWLGDVPDHWEICALKRIVRMQSGESITSESIKETGDYPVYGGNGLRGYTSEFTHDGHFVLVGRQGALCGNINYGCGQFWASEHAVVATPIKKCETVWLGEMMRSMNLNQYSLSAAQPGLSVDHIARLGTTLPPLSEQTAIAEFLDRETAKIDGLVADYRLLMELLKEKRQAVISHVVTKGLNPHTPMKPSGIEWLGDVPVHWGVVSLRYVFEIKAGGDLKDGLFSKEKSKDHPYPIYTNSIKQDEVYGFTSKSLFRANTITVTGRGDIGYATYRDHEYDAIIRLLVLTPRRNEPCKYYEYFVNSMVKFLGGNTAVSQLSAEQIRPYKVFTPTLPEQLAIVSHLDTELAKFDALTADAQQAIDLLQERRTALISAAVTGQIDVRQLPRN